MKPSHISYWWPVYSPKSQLFKANGRVQNTILHPWCAYRVTTLTKYLGCHPILRRPALLLLLNAACLAEKQKIQIFSLWFNPTRAHSWSTASGRVSMSTITFLIRTKKNLNFVEDYTMHTPINFVSGIRDLNVKVYGKRQRKKNDDNNSHYP